MLGLYENLLACVHFWTGSLYTFLNGDWKLFKYTNTQIQIHKFTKTQRQSKRSRMTCRTGFWLHRWIVSQGRQQNCEKKIKLQLVNSHNSAPCNNSTPWLQLLLGFPFPPLLCSCSRHPSCAQMQDHPRLQRKSRIVKKAKCSSRCSSCAQYVCSRLSYFRCSIESPLQKYVICLVALPKIESPTSF